MPRLRSLHNLHAAHWWTDHFVMERSVQMNLKFQGGACISAGVLGWCAVRNGLRSSSHPTGAVMGLRQLLNFRHFRFFSEFIHT